MKREIVQKVPANHVQIGDVIRIASRDWRVRDISVDKPLDRRYLYTLALKGPLGRPAEANMAGNHIAPHNGVVDRVRVVWERAIKAKAKAKVR